VLNRHLGPGHVAPPGYPALEPSGEPLAQAGAAREAAAVLDLQGPIAVQGTEEFPAAFAELRSRLDLGAVPLGLLGPSMGAAVAQLVLTDPGAGIHARAAVLVSPMVVQLRPAVDAAGRRFGVTTRGDRRRCRRPAGPRRTCRSPAVGRAAGGPARRRGAGRPRGLPRAGAAAEATLAGRYDDCARVELVVVARFGRRAGRHGGAAAPHAATVDRHAATWLRRHLNGRPATPAAGQAVW